MLYYTRDIVLDEERRFTDRSATLRRKLGVKTFSFLHTPVNLLCVECVNE